MIALKLFPAILVGTNAYGPFKVHATGNFAHHIKSYDGDDGDYDRPHTAQCTADPYLQT